MMARLALATLSVAAGAERILDAHVHSIIDHSTLNYTYDAGTIFDYDWGHADYVKATRPSLLPPTEFVFMSLVGVPKAQHLDQVRLAQREAERIDAAGEIPKMVGVVTDADLSDAPADFEAFLDEASAASPRLVGARPHTVPWEHEHLVPNLAALHSRGLALDVLISDSAELKNVYPMASKVPELQIVLNHFGFVPDGPLPDFEAWAAAISQIATLPNVHIKISGGMAPASPEKAVEVMRPFVEHVVREFGYERCIYNGNWFVVDTQAGFYSYRSWASAVVHYLDVLNATAEERASLLHDTGARVYGLSQRMLV